jgi:hypothetical protein
MSAGDIERTLPIMMDVLREILKAHPNEKGILHCVDALTPVVMADGSTRPISSLVEGDLVTSWNEPQRKFEIAPVLAVMNNGVRDCIELELGFKYNIQKSLLYRDEELVDLSAKELELLSFLVQNRGFFVSIESLHENVWENKDISYADIRMCIKRVREKTDKDFIKTKRFLGYKIDK